MENTEENNEMIWKIQMKIVKWFGKYGRKVSWNVKWIGKYKRKYLLDRGNMEEKRKISWIWKYIENMEEKSVE